MTPVECVQLVAYVRMRSPRTFIVDGTPDAWYGDLQHFDARAAREAVDTLTRRPGDLAVSLGDLLVEIRKVRSLRIERHGEPVLDVDPDDTKAFQRALIDARRRIADGEELPIVAAGELQARPVAALTAGRTIPVDDAVRTERRLMLRKAAHARRQQVDAGVEAKARRLAHVEEARKELDGIRDPA